LDLSPFLASTLLLDLSPFLDRGIDGEARARALAKGLDGTFLAYNSIKEINETITSLVGKPAAKALLPGEFYPRLINQFN
jgi:hypothetical protein